MRPPQVRILPCQPVFVVREVGHNGVTPDCKSGAFGHDRFDPCTSHQFQMQRNEAVSMQEGIKRKEIMGFLCMTEGCRMNRKRRKAPECDTQLRACMHAGQARG